MADAGTAAADAIRIDQVGAIGRVHLDGAGGPASSPDWRRWVGAYDHWIADPNIYGALIRRVGFHAIRREQALSAPADAGALAEIAEATRLIWTIDRFTKPTVALLDGPISWRDYCLVRHVTHKVAGEHFRLSFSLAAASVPDAGASWWLARLPSDLGLTVALEGRTIDGADAVALGLATHHIAAHAFDGIESAYADAEPIDQVLDGLPQLGGDDLSGRAPAATEGPEMGLAAERGLCHELLAEARGLTLKQTLERDYALALCLSRADREAHRLRGSDWAPYLDQAISELCLAPMADVPQALG